MAKFVYIDARDPNTGGATSFHHVFVEAANSDEAYTLGQRECERLENLIDEEDADHLVKDDPFLVEHFEGDFLNDYVIPLD